MGKKISKEAWELSRKMTWEEAKNFKKEVRKLAKDVEKELFVPVADMVIKTLLTIARDEVTVAELVFVKQENGTANVELRIGGLKVINNKGEKIVIADTSAIAKIESHLEGGEEVD